MRVMVLTLLSVFVWTQAVFACPQGQGDNPPSFETKLFKKYHFLIGHKKEMNLTDDQVKQIKNLKFELSKRMVQSEAQMKLAKMDIYQELHADTSDPEKIEVLIDQSIEEGRALTKAVVKAIHDMQTLLTPEQRAKAKEIFWEEYEKGGSETASGAWHGHKG